MKSLAVFLFCAVLLVCGVVVVTIHARKDVAVLSDGVKKPFFHIVVLDAGHGGEDGGAVARDGTMEKDLNLTVTRTVSALFSLFGVPHIQTRTSDVSVGDVSLPTVRERKRSDILTRFRTVNQCENSLLLSIHQNLFPDPKYYGTQVFYAGSPAESKTLAERIQRSVVTLLQPQNKREIKRSDSHIYLLYHAKRPSVMVECGFLSNPDELNKLKTDTYTTALSYAVVRGILRYLNTLERNGTPE